MKYTVIWKPSARRELAEIWNDASDRQAVADAANEIDRRLAVDPEHEGESRESGFRVIFITRLAASYHVSLSDRLVSVLRIWSVKRNG